MQEIGFRGRSTAEVQGGDRQRVDELQNGWTGAWLEVFLQFERPANCKWTMTDFDLNLSQTL